ncbi:MAG: radical SAM protein, partial [Planctomycetota bacterium]|nr:radical SAM protein [Planctomycetota bacterium]
CSVTQIHRFSCGKVIPPAYLSGKQIEMLLERITKQLPETNVIYFVEDSILPTTSRLDDFCGALKKFNPPFKYRVQAETDKIYGEETIKKLADAGVFHISFGVENCSPRIRKLMNKPQDEQRIENIIHWCKNNNIIAYYLIILFSPESLMEDLIINYKTLTRWLAEGNVMVSVEPFMMPYRGAPIFNQDFEMGYQFIKLSNGKTLKHPYIIYPKDPAVKEIMFKLKDRLPAYIERMQKEERHSHQSKDWTGKVIVKLLGDLLSEGGYL